MNTYKNIQIHQTEIHDLDTNTNPVTKQPGIVINGETHIPYLADGKVHLIDQSTLIKTGGDHEVGDLYVGTNDRKIRVAGRWLHLVTEGTPHFIECPDANRRRSA